MLSTVLALYVTNQPCLDIWSYQGKMALSKLFNIVLFVVVFVVAIFTLKIPM